MRPRLPAHRILNPEGHAAFEHVAPHGKLGVLLTQPGQLGPLILAQLPVTALPAAPVSVHPVAQRPLLDPELPGHPRDRLAGLPDPPHPAPPEVRSPLPSPPLPPRNPPPPE